MKQNRAKKNEIIRNLHSKVKNLSSKVSKHEKHADQKEQYLRRNSLLVRRIKEVKSEAKDDITIETISQNLDIDITPHDKERSHRICQSKPPREKLHSVIV